MTDITITAEQLTEVKKFVNGIPTLYGKPLLDFFQVLENQADAKVNAAEKAPKKSKATTQENK